MSMGADRAEAQPQGDSEWTSGNDQGLPAPETMPFHQFEEEEEAPPRSTGTRILAGLLVLLALGWLGVSGYALTLAWPGPSLVAWTGWVATVSAPLILLGLVWLIFGRTSRRETLRFTESVAAMRRESQALESVLAIVAGRLQENRASLSEEAARLMALGDEASDRLGRVTHYLSRETAELDRKSQALEQAAANARVDIGVLISDLPKAEEQARTAAESMDQAAAQMNAAVDGAMARTSESVDQVRSGLEAQGQAMLAMVEQSRAVFEHAGVDASRRLAERLEQVGSKIEWLAGQLAAQDAASQTMVNTLSARLIEIDTQIATIGQSGDEHGGRL